MELLTKYGYSLVFVVVLMEQLGLPIPALPILLLAGALAARGILSFPVVLIFGIVAAMAGDVVWFFIGRIKGRGILQVLCKISLSPDSCVRKTEASFLKYGMNSLLFAKFVPGLNTIAPPMAGMFRASIGSFLARDFIGAFAYIASIAVTGLLFDKAIFDVTKLLEALGQMVLWIVLGGLALYVLWRYIRLKMIQRTLFKERITPAELNRMMTLGEELVVVDIRSNFVHGEDGIIPGAIRIAPDEIDVHTAKLPKDRWIVMYCT